jgi:hypothetical protein
VRPPRRRRLDVMLEQQHLDDVIEAELATRNRVEHA